MKLYTGLVTLVCVGLFYHIGACDIQIQGLVADTKGEPVANALVELYTVADSLLVQDRTDNSGHYVLWLTTRVGIESSSGNLSTASKLSQSFSYIYEYILGIRYP
ncbi:MAG: carboxypeptidase-like regulatory domain-containing protein [candidate division KSB1 bacterium]|nr:carboxypeptidase-like regulatory domain-containing protein [candidate division KSB1 bacterium]